MIKNLSILVLGILIGVGGVSIYLISQIEPSESAQAMREAENGGKIIVTPEIDYDEIYDKLMEEKKVEPDEKTWFEDRLSEMESEAQGEIDKMNSAGDEAAKMFEQFSLPAEEKPSEQK